MDCQKKRSKNLHSKTYSVNTSKGKNVISLDVKNYIKFCLTLELKQLIKAPTRTTCNTSTLIDILTSSSKKVVQAGIIETSLSDHHLIFYTRKIKRAKPNKHNYLSFRSVKNFTTEIDEEALGKMTFPHCENFGCVNKAYSDLTSNTFDVVNNVAPTKTIRVKKRKCK